VRLKDRQSKNHFNVVENQLRDGLFRSKGLGPYCTGTSWAIGTGETASPEQVQEMHEFIRETVRKSFEVISEDVCILLW
jgi:triosephosphate isomerase